MKSVPPSAQAGLGEGKEPQRAGSDPIGRGGLGTVMAVKRQQETFELVTLGHIRSHGCRDLLVYCISGRCHHSATLKPNPLALLAGDHAEAIILDFSISHSSPEGGCRADVGRHGAMNPAGRTNSCGCAIVRLPDFSAIREYT